MFLVTDNEAEDDLVILFRQHISLCPKCAGHFAYTSQLLALLRKRCHRVAAPAGLEIRIRRRLLTVRHQTAETS